MFGRNWATSERKNYNIVAERDIKVPMRDGVEISVDVFRPDSKEKFPAILGVHGFGKNFQLAPMKPVAFTWGTFVPSSQEKGAGMLESGNPNFFVRRGYVQVIANVRGTGKSGGKYDFYGLQERRDNYEVIEWIAGQPWCSGKVGMFGPSYFGTSQLFVAALNPPSLKCLFAPWAHTDWYRDVIYRGGIFNWIDRMGSTKGGYGSLRYESVTRKKLGDEKFKEAIANALQDDDISAIPELVSILKNPDEKGNGLMVDIILNPLDGTFWEERRTRYDTIEIPSYIGGCWGVYGTHLPGAFRSWENLKGPKKMIIGPPMYLERPVHQLHYEALRWFDYWLKEIDTRIMEESPIKLFIMGTNQWKETDDWPLPGTKWTPFYLHEEGLLSEHEHWPNEGSDSFADSQWHRGSLEYYSPNLVEDTEVIGPIMVKLYASTTDDEVFWRVSLREVDQQGNERILTQGWLRGTHREIDQQRSKPWAPFYTHKKSEKLTPGKIYEFDIPIMPTGNLFKAGSKIGLKISSVDDVPTNTFEQQANGNIRRQSASRITVYHNADYASYLLLPITMGNILGTFFSGGKPYA